MLTPILIGLAVLAIVFVIFVATWPNEFRITRTTTMAASSSAVFAQLNDFHLWLAWSPWE
jgi:ABC-type dipeptide/oligopeptide/nickel transport system permease subunit